MSEDTRASSDPTPICPVERSKAQPFKFTPVDFISLGLSQSKTVPEHAALIANQILEAHTAKWVKVYASDKYANGNWTSDRTYYDLYCAYLTPPQLLEIPECKHEPEVDYINNRRVLREKCKYCGEPLIASWSSAQPTNPAKGGSRG